MALQGQPVAESATIPCKEANTAMIWGIVSLFCLGVILGPVAIIQSMKAKELMNANPRLTGSGKATTGLILGIIGFVGHILVLVIRFGGAR
jgi:hypothetical protein